jgi:hypothetical protein
VLFVLLHGIRALMVASLWPVLARGHYEFTWRHAVATTYGGLRGAVGLTLGLIVHETLSRHEAESSQLLGDEVLFYVSGVAILTLVVNGTTMEAVLAQLGLAGSTQSARRAYERVTLELAEEVTLLARSLKAAYGDAQDASGVDWAAALAYVPARSEAAYQLLNAAICEEIELTAKRENRPAAAGENAAARRRSGDNGGRRSNTRALSWLSTSADAREQLRSSTTSDMVNPLRATAAAAAEGSGVGIDRGRAGSRAVLTLANLQATVGGWIDGNGGEAREWSALDELLQRVPDRLKGRILRNEKKWPSALSGGLGGQHGGGNDGATGVLGEVSAVSVRSAYANPTALDRKVREPRAHQRKLACPIFSGY